MPKICWIMENYDNLANRILPVRKHWRQERWNVMEPVRKHWRQGRFERKRGNAETFNLFNAFMVSKVFNELHCLYCPSLPILSFCAFYILQCPSVQKAELWALRACFFWKLPLPFWWLLHEWIIWNNFWLLIKQHIWISGESIVIEFIEFMTRVANASTINFREVDPLNIEGIWNGGGGDLSVQYRVNM